MPLLWLHFNVTSLLNTHWENLYDVNHQLHSRWGRGRCIQISKSEPWVLICTEHRACLWLSVLYHAFLAPLLVRKGNEDEIYTTAGIMLKSLIDPNWLLKCFVWNWAAEVQGEQKIYTYIFHGQQKWIYWYVSHFLFCDSCCSKRQAEVTVGWKLPDSTE